MGAPGGGLLALNGNVTLVEPMGSETYVHLRAGDADMLARLGGDQIPRLGEAVALNFDPDRAHLFEAGSGSAVWHGGSAPA